MIGISRLYCGGVEASDSLRFGRSGSSADQRSFHAQGRPVVVWNCTCRCHLRCQHCYSQSNLSPAEGELSTEQAEAMLDDLAVFGVPVVLFSGGEPLLRPDLLHLLARTRQLGMRAVLSTNGTLIDEAIAAELGEIGISYVGISLDGLGASNDRFRGCEGAFAAALAGIRRCRSAGLKVGLRFTMHSRNIDDLGGIFSLLETEDIPRVCFYHLVQTGRGAGLGGQLGHEPTRRAIDTIIDHTRDLHTRGLPKEVLTVDNHCDGPYLYLRMLAEGSPRAAAVLELLRRTGGNASGQRIGCISWDGSVHPDQFWRTQMLGNVANRPFSQIWTDPAQGLLGDLRRRRELLVGRCAGCRFLDCCGGNFRARAEAATGDRWAADPACYLRDDEIAGDAP